MVQKILPFTTFISLQLMDIVKYLRREKDILRTKMEALTAEDARLKSQLEAKERELADTK